MEKKNESNEKQYHAFNETTSAAKLIRLNGNN